MFRLKPLLQKPAATLPKKADCWEWSSISPPQNISIQTMTVSNFVLCVPAPIHSQVLKGQQPAPCPCFLTCTLLYFRVTSLCPSSATETALLRSPLTSYLPCPSRIFPSLISVHLLGHLTRLTVPFLSPYVFSRILISVFLTSQTMGCLSLIQPT